jgi:hypothetical protein
MNFHGLRPYLNLKLSAAFPEAISNKNLHRSPTRRFFVYLSFIAIMLAGNGAIASAQSRGAITFSYSSVSFGNVTVGATKTITVTMKNTGTASVSITGHSANPSGYSYTGLSVPYTLSPGQSIALAVRFTPRSSGFASGVYSFTGSLTSSFSVNGTGVSAASGQSSGTLISTPASANFGTVATGTTNTQTFVLKNTGSATITLASVAVSGSGLRIGDLTIPRPMAPGQTETFTIAYTPTASGGMSGSATFRTATNSTLTIPLSGNGGGATRIISLSTSSLNFGNEKVGVGTTLGVAVKNTGNTSLTVSQINVSGTGFSVQSGVAGATIAAGQTAQLNVAFTPKGSGGVSGTVSIVSNASNSPASIAVSGTGVSSVAHSVSLSWNPSSGGSGYQVYRSSRSGGSYSRVTSAAITGTKYTDGAVTSGATYYYVVTAVSSNGSESAFSSQVEAEVP